MLLIPLSCLWIKFKFCQNEKRFVDNPLLKISKPFGTSVKIKSKTNDDELHCISRPFSGFSSVSRPSPPSSSFLLPQKHSPESNSPHSYTSAIVRILLSGRKSSHVTVGDSQRRCPRNNSDASAWGRLQLLRSYQRPWLILRHRPHRSGLRLRGSRLLFPFRWPNGKPMKFSPFSELSLPNTIDTGDSRLLREVHRSNEYGSSVRDRWHFERGHVSCWSFMAFRLVVFFVTLNAKLIYVVVMINSWSF